MKRVLIFHPLLFAVFLVVGVYSQNASQVPIDWLFRPLFALILIAIIVFLFFWKIFKDPEYSGYATTVFLFWLFTGHVYRLLLDASPFWRTPVGGIGAIFLFSIPLGLLASRLVWKRLTNPRAITTFLNVVSVFLIIMPVWVTISTLHKANSQIRTLRERQPQVEVPLADSAQPTPDIYLIIVDGYGRADLLGDLYGFDNSPFLSFLTEKGFYVTDRATSNYPQTELSLSSSLNLNYLDEYVDGFGNTSDRGPLRELLQHTTMRRLLEDQGYQFVALPSATLFAQIRDADIYFSLTSSNVNEFEGLLLSSTVAGVAVDAFGVDLPVQSYELHRRYILYALDKLMGVPELPGPKFVFAHILSPHPPFIFGREGEFIIPERPYSTWDASLFPGTQAEYQEGYIDQMIFLNRQLVEVITGILEKSSTPPIIILQGDHGPGLYYNTIELDTTCLYERYSILSAYYFPDGDYQSLYPSITPVNTFRVILNQYFGGDMELLEDRNYFAGWLAPYLFTDVTEQVNSCQIVPRE
jgi:hypothetical protein